MPEKTAQKEPGKKPVPSKKPKPQQEVVVQIPLSELHPFPDHPFQVPVIVRDIDRDAAIIIMVDSNLQRENILPSERAQAYKMKLEAIRRKAGRPAKTKEKADENNSPQVAANFRADDTVAKDAGKASPGILRVG